MKEIRHPILNDGADHEIARALQELAGAMRHLEAAPSLESRLLAEFRRSKMRRRRTPVWLASAAAAIFAIAGTLAFLGSRMGSDGPSPVADRNPALAASRESQRSPQTGLDAGDTKRPGINAADRNSPTEAAGSQAPKPRNAITAEFTKGPNPRRSTGTERRPSAVSDPPREIVTDFFPLMDAPLPFERGELVRVSVPAAAMRSVGLPVDEDRLSDPVQADVLIGEEGLARSIRFVGFRH